MLDKLKDGVGKNKMTERKIKNLLISEMAEDYAYGNIEGGWNYFFYDVDITVPRIYYGDYDAYHYSSTEATEYKVQVSGITNQSISYLIAEINSYQASRGPGYSNRYFTYYNLSTTDFTPIRLSDLFIENSNYKDVLNDLVLKEIAKLDNTEVACYKPSEYFEMVKNSFAITEKGLKFYFPIHNRDGAWDWRSEERRVGKECRSRWSPDH